MDAFGIVFALPESSLPILLSFRGELRFCGLLSGIVGFDSSTTPSTAIFKRAIVQEIATRLVELTSMAQLRTTCTDTLVDCRKPCLLLGLLLGTTTKD